MQVTVDDILNKVFLSRNWEERMSIVIDGKPRPFLNMAPLVIKTDPDGEVVETQQFSMKIYDNVPWLTGCQKRNSFFCWPCLLLKPKLGLWNSTGVSNLTYLVEGMSKHEESVLHIEAMLQFQAMLEEYSAASKTDVTQYNDIVKRNRQILKRLIDAVCCLFTIEKDFSKRNKGCQLELEKCRKRLQFMRPYDKLNCNYIEDAVDLITITPQVINDVVDAIAKTIKLAIRKELQASTYVSIILSDHSEIASKSQISTILRYISDGKVVEKFVGFMNMRDQKTLDFVFRHIALTVAEFGIAERLLAVSLDGGILPTSELSKLVEMIKEKCPNTLFVPWHGHDLDYVLQKSLTNIKDCGAYFAEMNEMKDFFKKKPKREEAFKAHLKSSNLVLKDKWLVDSQFIPFVNCNRKHFIAFFESMMQNSEKWEAEDVTIAFGFKHILENFRTKFFLQAFFKLNEIIAPLSGMLRCRAPETVFGSEKHQKVLKQLSAEFESGFEELWYEANKDEFLSLPEPLAKKIKIDYDDPRIETYRDLYASITSLLINEIDCRFSTLGMLHFCHLLSCDQFGNFVFSNDMLQSLMAVHGSHFCEEQLKNELIVLRTNGTVFGRKTVNELLNFFIQMKLKGGLKYVYKLCEFVLTLPIKRPEDDCGKLEKISGWSYIPEVLTVQSGDICIPCVELEYLKELQKSDTFYGELSEVFYEGNKTFELIYK